jgi:8-oxo-dGTP pyrophosphatase MutT (NUDIX family)
MSDPLTFDGVLPRWHGRGFRLEVDRITGRQKLHLCVAETTYFALRATQDPDAMALAGDAALCARLLGLNLLAYDHDDVIVLIRRSDYVVYPGRYAGTVTGNCELAPREGLAADLDENGLPDLLAALAREAREELGLDLTREDAQLSALGVIEYSSESELGSRALVATARLPGRASDFRIERSAPDPIEGLWELGGDFMTIDLAAVLNNKQTGHRFVLWLRRADNLAPQAAGSLLLLLTSRIELRQHQAARADRNQRADSAPWTISELAQWLDEELPESPVNISDIIHHYPLWA